MRGRFHGIKAKRSRKTAGSYSYFRRAHSNEQTWMWTRQEHFNFLDGVMTKRGIAAILCIATFLIGLAAYSDPSNLLFHSQITSSVKQTDPTSPIQKYTAPSGTLGEFNSLGSTSYVSNCGGVLGNTPCAQISAQSPFTQGNLTKAAGASKPLGAQTYASQPKMWYSVGRWWMFFAGENDGINVTSSVTGQSTWTEISGEPPACNSIQLLESTSFAIAVNSSGYAFFAIGLHATNALYFYYGKLAIGGITWYTPFGNCLIPSTFGQVQTPDLLFTSPSNVYLFYNEANVNAGCTAAGSGNSCSVYQQSNGTLTSWGSQNILFFNNPGCPGDNLQSSVDMGNGQVYSITWAFAIANSCDGNTGWAGGGTGVQPKSGFYGHLVKFRTVLANENVPSTPGFYTGTGVTACGPFTVDPANVCYLAVDASLFETSPGVITGAFTYTLARTVATAYFNQTLAFTPVWSSRPSGGPWPVPQCPQQCGMFYESGTNTEGPGGVQGILYNNFTKNYIAGWVATEPAGNGNPYNFLESTIIDANFQVVTLTANPISFINGEGNGMQPPRYAQATNNVIVEWENYTGGTGQIWVESISTTGNTQWTGMLESVTPIGDLSPIVGKELEFKVEFIPSNNNSMTPITFQYTASFGWFLTTNASLWKTTNTMFNPYSDPSISLLGTIGQTVNGKPGVGTISQTLWVQQKQGESIGKEDTGGCSGSGYICGNTLNHEGNTIGLSWADLNFTGASLGINPTQVGSGATCPTDQTAGAVSCSYAEIGASPVALNFSVKLPTFALSGETYYLGLFVGANQQGSSISFCYDLGAICASRIALVTGGCYSASMEIDYCIPNAPVIAIPATTDSSGFIGAIWRTLTGVGSAILTITKPIWGPAADIVTTAANSIANAFLAALQEAGSFILNQLAFLETLWVGFLNTVGNALGFGPIGTDFQTFVNATVQFFTTGFSGLWFLNIGNVILYLVTLSQPMITITNQWITFSLAVATFTASAMVFAVVVILDFTQGLTLFFGLGIILLFITYVGDYGLYGIWAWLQLGKFLTIETIGTLEHFINWGINIGVWVCNLMPEIMGTKFNPREIPRMPIISDSVRLSKDSFPNGKMQAAREGDPFSLIFIGIATIFLAWYETSNFPGTIGSISGTSVAGSHSLITGMATILIFLAGLTLFFVLPAGLTRVFPEILEGSPMIGTNLPMKFSVKTGTPRAMNHNVTFRKWDGRFERQARERVNLEPNTKPSIVSSLVRSDEEEE